MIINELLKEDPQVGDAIDLECGDVLIETVIEDITEDGIVVKLDETAMRLMMEARKQYIAESRQGVMENWGAGLSGKNDPIFTEKPLTQSALKVKKILQNFNPALYSEVMVGFGHGTDERRIKDHFKPIELALGKLPLDSESHREYDFLVLKVTDPSLFRLLLNLYFEYLKEYRDNSVFAQVFLTPKSNQQKQGMAEGTEDDLDNLNRLIDRTDANLSRRGDPARYDDVEVDEKAKIIYWVTQETTPAQSKEFAIRFAKILKNNGYNGWTVKVVRTDYWNGKRSPWRVAKTEKGVAEGHWGWDPPDASPPKRDPDEWKSRRDEPPPNLRLTDKERDAEKEATKIKQAELEKTMKALARMRGDVEEGRVSQLPTRGADYSKYDTDHLEMLLRPGILHRNELRFKNLIRKELEKRRQAKPVDPKNLVVPLSDVPVKKPRGHKQYDPAKEFPGVFKEQDMSEAEYQGRKVPLGKPMKGDVKKSKVYVKGPKGNVVKVNFGDKNMRIKKSNPGRRKSFRARHNCDNPGPRWKARYWSCRAW